MVFKGVNVTYDDGGDMVATLGDGTEVVYNLGNLAWIIVAAAFVMIMAVGLGFLYAGLLRHKSATTALWLAFVTYSVGVVTWFFWAYSLAFGVGGKFIGDLHNFGFIGVMDEPSGSVPMILFAWFQMQFAAVTCAIWSGAFADRARLLPVILFTFCWVTIVYAPVAHWVWSSSGWLFQLGDLDFAGGGPVHVNSGAAALAISIFLGKRHGYGTEVLAYRPHNISHIVTGTALLFFGWFGFNGGSELGTNLRSVQACVVTNIAACMGGLTWMGIDAVISKRPSVVSFCSGVIAGLVGITPASGYVGAPASIAIGFVAATVANFGTYLVKKLRVDDSLDIFAEHGIAGFWGAVLTALFAEQRYTGLDGASEGSGWPDHTYITLGYNLAGVVTIMAYSFVLSYILLFAINYIPGCHFRATEEEEIVGSDIAFLGESVCEYSPLPLHSHLHHSSDGSTEKLPGVHAVSAASTP